MTNESGCALVNSSLRKQLSSWAGSEEGRLFSQAMSTVTDLGEGPGGPPLFWVKTEEITEERKEKTAGQAKQNRPTPLNSRSGSATGQLSRDTGLELIILLLN